MKKKMVMILDGNARFDFWWKQNILETEDLELCHLSFVDVSIYLVQNCSFVT